MDSNKTQKQKTISLLTGILILAVGVILIICNKMITGQGVVVLAGILFMLTGIVNIVLYVTRRNAEGKHVNSVLSMIFGWLVSIAAIILGICMLCYEETFRSLIPFIFGLLIFFGAVTIAVSFIVGLRKAMKIPDWIWLSPVVMVILGVITLLQDSTLNEPLVMILTGSSLIVFGLTAVIVCGLVADARRKAKKAVTAPSQAVETQDVEAKQISSSND